MPLPRLISRRHSIGGMNRQITLCEPGGRNPVDGGNLPQSPVFTSWADIHAASGAELDKAQQIGQVVGHVISIPYQTGVELEMIVKFETRSFLIKYIEDEEERHIFLDLYCAEVGQNAGSQN